MSDSSNYSLEKKVKKKKKKIWRTSSSLMSIELKWRDEDRAVNGIANENLWKRIREEHRREKEYHDYYLTKLTADIGPIWYQELSNPQRESLSTLRLMMHMDIGQGTPSRVMRILATLGILPRYKSLTVMTSLKRSDEDPILFFNDLYHSVYNLDPSQLQERYILEQKLILSSMVFLGINDVILELERKAKYVLSPKGPPKLPPPQKRPKPPKSVYLAADPFIPLISTKMYKRRPPAKEPSPLSEIIMKKFGLISDDEDSDASENAPKKNRRPTKKLELPGVAHTPHSPHGHSNHDIINFTAYDCCGADCECVRWYPAIVKYINQKRMEAEELRRKNAKPPKKKSRKKPEKKKARRRNNKKKPVKKKKTHPIKIDTFLKVLLEEQAETGASIPSLPEVYKLPILQEWARKRLKGGVTNEESEKTRLDQNVRWRFLLTERFRTKPPKLPFTDKQLFSMNWNHRPMINKMVDKLHTQFHKKVKRKLIHTGQLWWPTMETRKFPNTTFRDVFFSYVPGREEDLYLKDIKK